MKARLIMFVLLAIITRVNGQHQKTIWTGSLNTIRVTPKLSLLADFQYRTSDRLKSTQTIILRPGINYHLSGSLTLTAGYAYIPSRRIFTEGGSALIPEQRIWQQLMLSKKFKEVQIINRLRFEERFIPRVSTKELWPKQKDSDLSYRFRYFVRTIIPFQRDSVFQQGPFMAVQNEVFVNAANRTVVNGKYFDQNRAYFALGYRIKKADLEIGYMNQLVSQRTSRTYNHILQVLVYTRL